MKTYSHELENLKARYNSKEKLDFLFFWGHHKSDEIKQTCFSQWYDLPFTSGNYIYPTAEHWMMAQKALQSIDFESFYKILGAKTPKEAKELGRSVKNFNSGVWDSVKLDIVKHGNILKFEQNPKLLEYLLSTRGKILVEASPYDKIWGIGLQAKDSWALNPNKWQGENLLGFVLMDIRDNYYKGLEFKDIEL